MNESSKDTGVATALLTRFTTQRFPKILALKEKVDRGERLDDFDLAFLHDVMDHAREVKPLVDRHPEYQEVYAQAISLYGEITGKALENEKTAHPGG